MVFSSIVFIYFFLPLVLFLYFLAEKTGLTWLKNTTLLLASLAFYAWGGQKYLIMLLILCGINYICGILIERSNHRKLFLILGLGLDLLVLVFYKYLNFLVGNIESAVHALGNTDFSMGIPAIAMPIGISFFTFQIMSYLVDVYRKDVPAQKNPAWLTLYVMMFPQLIAGPIVRYSDIDREIASRRTALQDVEIGIKRFIVGFAKKVFLANCMGSMADTVFAANGTTNTVYAWLGICAYALQIYFDFSAYSDMAIGLGRVFGFHFNENFNYPYISKSIQEFWRRWHISLSSWFRDYVYIPLGGNRKGTGRTYFNLFMVFLLTGIWHGAAWQFILWGLFHGAFMLIERIGFSKILKKLPGFVCHIYTLAVVLVAWVFFRADNLTIALQYIKTMFSFNFTDFINIPVLSKISNMFILFGVISVLASTPLFKKLGKTKLASNTLLMNCGYLLLFFLSVIYLAGLSYNPFIYFKF